MEEKKKASIFSLYEKEKKITLTDDNGNSVDVLFVKMTQGELSKAVELYNEKLREEREKLKNNKLECLEIKNLIYILNKKELINTILDVEKVYRNQFSDLYPLEDEKDKTLEQKTQERKLIFNQWVIDREKELSELNEDELLQRLIDLRIENFATMRASIHLNNYSLSVMVRDPDTKEPIFKTIDDVLKIKDKSILDKLIITLDEFRYNLSEKNIRKEAQDVNFIPAGQSQEK